MSLKAVKNTDEWRKKGLSFLDLKERKGERFSQRGILIFQINFLASRLRGQCEGYHTEFCLKDFKAYISRIITPKKMSLELFFESKGDKSIALSTVN